MPKSEKYDSPPFEELSEEQQVAIEEAVDEVFHAADGLMLLEEMLANLNTKDLGPTYKPMKITLESLWHYLEGIKLIEVDGNFGHAQKELKESETGFRKLGYKVLLNLAKGLRGYAEAVFAVQTMNYGFALQKFEKVRARLRKASKYGKKYEFLIDHFEPDMFYLAGMQYMFNFDLVNAKIMIDKASRAARFAADTHHPEESPSYYYLYGLAKSYQATYDVSKVQSDFLQFEFDKIVADEKLTEDAFEAKNLLGKAGVDNILAQNSLNLVSAFCLILESSQTMAKIMVSIFHSTFTPDLQILSTIRGKLQSASELAARCGPQAESFVKFCNQLINQTKNLERIAQPSKSDFGKFSGIVTCVLFLPLFVIVSWSNSVFEVGLDASSLLSQVIILSLIGGFGYGVMRFKGLFLKSTD